MSWTTIVWSMVAAACLTLAFIHLPVWLRNRAAWPSLFFALLCVSTATMSMCELWTMHAATPQQYAERLRWWHVPVWGVFVALVGFISTQLGTGRAWLGWTVVALRSAVLVANFTSGVNVNFLEVSGLRRTEFLGDVVSAPVGIVNPWTAVSQLTTWLCVAFVADASVTAWRRGVRAQALRIGAAATFFMAFGAVQGLLIVVLGTAMPLVSSLCFSATIAAMAYELSRDRSRTEQMAADLRESEQRMVLAADAANLGIWSRDLANGEIWANLRWRGLIGFTADEPVTREALLRKVHPDDRDRVGDILLDAHPPPGGYATEFRVLLPDGNVRWIASQGEVEAGTPGRALRTRGVSIDCTERKRSEHEALLLREEIAHVGRVTVLGQLAAGLAHEINQPLGAILRNAEAASLFLEQPAPDLDEIRAILEDIRKDDQRAGAVISRMRALLRRQELEVRPLGPDELLADVAALLRPEAAARGVRLHVETAGALPPVAGDRVHLQQVLLNLVSNAMDAIDAAGGERRAIEVSARRDGEQAVEFTVQDSGVGLSPGAAHRLFEPFFTTKPKGMGMGLAISRTIIEAHGGRLWAGNAADGGARFVFTVPIAGTEASA